jgi:MbtH protein
MFGDEDDNRIYKVVINHEEQYSIWARDRANPLGWRDEGTVGTKKACLQHIDEVWTDMRPLSLRIQMDKMQREAGKQGASEVRTPDEVTGVAQ